LHCWIKGERDAIKQRIGFFGNSLQLILSFHNEGTADIDNGTALVTTLEAKMVTNKRDPEKMISRIRSGIIHELGHLFDLEHHDELVGNNFCPMVNRTWDDPEFKTKETRASFFDTRDEVFCADCKTKIKTLIQQKGVGRSSC